MEMVTIELAEGDEPTEEATEEALLVMDLSLASI